MATLSKKQQANIELMWELEAKERSVEEAMAEAILELADRKALIMEQIAVIEDQVPESVQDTWDNVDEAHSQVELDARRAGKGDEYDRWRAASLFLEAAVGYDWRRLRSYQSQLACFPTSKEDEATA